MLIKGNLEKKKRDKTSILITISVKHTDLSPVIGTFFICLEDYLSSKFLMSYYNYLVFM